MGCPSCNSDDWKLTSFVHKQGIQHVSTNTTTVGTATSTGGLGVGAAKGSTSGIHQTELSIAAAPPAPPDTGSSVIGLTILFVASAIYFVDSFWLVIGIGLIGFVLGIILSLTASAEPMKEYKAAMSKWEITRMCQRCGHLYIPSNN